MHNLVAIRAYFTFGGFIKLFNDPAGACYPRDLAQCCTLEGQDDIRLQLVWRPQKSYRSMAPAN
jgi:hypothetical protein